MDFDDGSGEILQEKKQTMKRVLSKMAVTFLAWSVVLGASAADNVWVIDSQDDWAGGKKSTSRIEITDGQATSTDADSRFVSVVNRSKTKRAAASITFKQTTAWNNWKEVPNVGPKEASNALVFLPAKDGEYWMMGEHSKLRAKTNDGSDLRGYHAWFSDDMKTWKHCGQITTIDGKWMTTAEYADGKYYLYYDKPNDQDPHLIVDDDLSDGVVGKSYGMVLNDPTEGSDAGILRDEDGSFHLIYENWSYNDARKHSWDGPVAGHAISPDGIEPFKIVAPVVDDRTSPTGKIGEYRHPTSKTPFKYEIHTPEQNAYGDWTAIKVGGQYYLFCDYHPAGDKIRIGRWTGDSLDKLFTWCGALGMGHPDPSVGFAEGKFYLIQQRGDVDFISPGPWVGGVEARVGVDVSGNGKIEQWTDWREVKETYSRKPGFARIVDVAPASIDLRALPEGYGFAFEYRTSDAPERNCPVVMEQVELSFR